ncbi:MAG: hypothetical protein KDA60_10830 [Planctomycetales bacterium]|nr:hypothetical protein [Planctomycetales bacterium]
MSDLNARPNLFYPNVTFADDEISYSGGTSGFSTEIVYRVVGPTTFQQAFVLAQAAALPVIPGSDDGCIPPVFRTNITIEEVASEKGAWYARATYEAVCGPDDESISVSVGSATTTVTTALSTVEAVPLNIQEWIADQQGPNGQGFNEWDAEAQQFLKDLWGNLINVTPNGEVLGCEIPIPEPVFSITKCYPPGWLSNCDNFAQQLKCAYHTNSQPWRCFGPRELLFQGIEGDGTRINENCPDVELSFGQDVATCTFSYQPTIQIPFGTDEDGEPKFITKRGYEKFWTFNRKKLIEFPVHIETVAPLFGFVQQVLPECDFNVELFP